MSRPRERMVRTRRGPVFPAWIAAIVLVAALVVGVLYLGGRGKGSPLFPGGGSHNGSPSGASPPPKDCPLTGVTRPNVPNRPALAVKVENLPASRPQTGLSWADIIYEEPVEGGITRFIAVYQCRDAGRIEPVRSARLTDPDILVQFGHPLLGYAGGVGEVVSKVRRAGLIDVNYLSHAAAGAYHRDPSRIAPHNLYTSTRALYRAAPTLEGPPKPIFEYSEAPLSGARVHRVHLPFSQASDVYWKWSRSKKMWLRFHGTVPHTYSDGTQVSTPNVVVQVVKVVQTSITDANGIRSPEVVATGTGKAYVFRDGRVVVGRWSRPTLKDVTKFVDRSGAEIRLTPGTTWVELVPDNIPVSFS